MERNGLRIVLNYLRRQAIRQRGGVSDAMLLERYAHSRDEAAFELLLWRHGPLVQNVCRRLLRNEHDVEDAFQATFAALACKARTIRRQHSAAPWLYRVAYRTALAARARSGRFTTLPTECEPIAAPDDDLLWRDLRAVLDAEVLKLGEKYRSAFVLCYLEGLTHGEAAVRLGCPEGTVHSRLATAKVKLRRGLERRGVTLSGTGMALEFATRHVGAPPTVRLVQETLTTAFSMAGSPVSGTVAKSSVVTLTKGVLFTMWMQSYAAPALVTLVLGLVGVGAVGFQGKAGTKAGDEPAAGKVTQNAERTDVPLKAQFTKLTDISATDEPSDNGIKKRYSARLYDMVKNQHHKLIVQTESKKGFDTFLVQKEGDPESFKCKVVKINDVDLIFHGKGAYYRIKVGNKISDALLTPLTEAELEHEGIQTGKTAARTPERVKVDEAVTRETHADEIRKLYDQVRQTFQNLSMKLATEQSNYDLQRPQLKLKLLESEEALRRLEQRLTFEREMERKALTFLEERHSELAQYLSQVGKNVADEKGTRKWNEDQFKAIRDSLEQKSVELSKKEEQRSQETIKIRFDVDEWRQKLRNLEEKWSRSSSRLETQLAQLEGRMVALKEQLGSPQLSTSPGINAEVSPASRLENKLDQVIRDLAEVKKLLAKPADERE